MSGLARGRRFLRDYAWIATAEVGSKAAGFVAFALLARRLGPESYGAVELAVAVAMVGLLLVDFGLGPTAARIATRDPARMHDMTGSVPAIRSALALAAVALATGCAGWLAGDAEGAQLIVLFAAALLFAAWTLDWLFQSLDRVKWVAPAQLLRMSVFLLGTLLFVHGRDQLLRIGFIEIAGFAALALYYVAAARAQGQRPRLQPDAGTVYELIREAAPVGAGQLLWVLNQYLPTLAIAWWLAGDELAYFAAAHRIVFGLGSFVFLYFFTLYPLLVRATADRREDFVPLTDLSLRVTAWLGGLVAIAGSLMARPLCSLAFGDAFEPSAPLLACLVWALPIHLVSGHARFSLIAAGEPISHMWAQAAGLVVSLCGCALLIPAFGALGAAIALLASACWVWLQAHVATRRRVGPIPGLAPLLRPAAATGLSLAIGLGAPLESAVAQTLTAIALFATLAAVLERRALRSLPALLTRASESSQP